MIYKDNYQVFGDRARASIARHSTAYMRPNNTSPLKYPIVLIHGYMDDPSSKLISMWKATETMLSERNISFYTPTIPRFGSIKERSQKCVKDINDHFKGNMVIVHLVAHSMGGLNARHIAAMSNIERGFYVRSVTTYGTPHHGVLLIDNLLTDQFKQGHKDLVAALHLFFNDVSDHGALEDMTCKQTKAFNARYPTNNTPEIAYFSWAGEISHFIPHLCSMVHWLIWEPSDGFVEVASATGPEGFTHLGTIEGVDHITMMGPENVALTIPYLRDVEAGRPIQVKKIENSIFDTLERRVDAFDMLFKGLFS